MIGCIVMHFVSAMDAWLTQCVMQRLLLLGGTNVLPLRSQRRVSH